MVGGIKTNAKDTTSVTRERRTVRDTTVTLRGGGRGVVKGEEGDDKRGEGSRE